MFEVVKAIYEAMDGFEEVGSSFQCLDAGRVQGEGSIAVSDRIGSAASSAESRGAVEEALGKESLWDRATTVKNLCKEADGLGGQAGLKGGNGGSATAKEELYVAKEGSSGVRFNGGCWNDWEIVE